MENEALDSKTLEAQNPDHQIPGEALGRHGLFGHGENVNGVNPNMGAPVVENGGAGVPVGDEDSGVGGIGSMGSVDVIGVQQNCALVSDSVDEVFARKEGSLEVVLDGKLVDSGSRASEEVAIEKPLGDGERKEEALVTSNGTDLAGEMEVLGGNSSQEVAFKEPLVDGGLKENEPVTSNGADLGRKIEVSGDNISLYVDFSSPVSGGTYEVSGRLDAKFHVGDIVWIKTKSRSWWPGKVYDPADVSKNSPESKHKTHLLVGYFGISHISWCLPSDLKPFHEDFQKISGANKGRSFVGAVEKALDQFSKCLRSETNCSCVVHEGNDSHEKAETWEGLSWPESRFGELSVSRFEPVELLGQIKSLAQVVSRLGVLELIAAKSRLSVFHHFMGHNELPIDQLFEVTNDEDGAYEKLKKKNTENQAFSFEGDADVMMGNDGDDVSEKGFDLNNLNSNFRKRKVSSEIKYGADASALASMSKEEESGHFESPATAEKGFDWGRRKRSRYSKYPQADWEIKGLMNEGEKLMAQTFEEGMNVFEGQFSASQSASKPSGKRFRKKWIEKFVYGNAVRSDPEFVKAAAPELLSELWFAAVDCLYPTENKKFDMAEWFFAKFRISVFHDESIYERNCKNMMESNMDMMVGEDAPTSETLPNSKAKPQKQKKRGPGSSDKAKMKSLNGLSNVNIDRDANNSLAASITPDVNAAPGKKRRKKQVTTPEMGPPSTDDKPKVKRRRKKKEASKAGVVINHITGIPDLNGNAPVPGIGGSGEEVGSGVTVVNTANHHQAAPALKTSDAFVAVVMPSGLKPKPADAPPVEFIRQNLEMMTSMLEKSGDNISLEMKAKLKSEIKGLLRKVTSMPSSSSTS